MHFFIEKELKIAQDVTCTYMRKFREFFLSRFDYSTLLSMMIALINFDASLVNVMTIHAGLHCFHSVYCFGICLRYGKRDNNEKKRSLSCNIAAK